MGDTLPLKAGGAMPWKECHVMDERLRFVARLLEGEKMAPLPRERHRAVAAHRAEPPLVCRRQGRVHAREATFAGSRVAWPALSSSVRGTPVRARGCGPRPRAVRRELADDRTRVPDRDGR